MNYVVTWGREHRRAVSDADELDRVLDEVASGGKPMSVGIYPPDELDKETSPWDDPPSSALEVGVGHPDRAFVVWLGPEGGVAVEPATTPRPAGAPDIAFDYGGDVVFAGPDRARVTPATARQAAREYVRTGTRPTCVEWAGE